MLGAGNEFTVDSFKPATVIAQFVTDENKIIEHPSYTVNDHKHNTSPDAFCADSTTETKDSTGFLEQVA